MAAPPIREFLSEQSFAGSPEDASGRIHKNLREASERLPLVSSPVVSLYGDIRGFHDSCLAITPCPGLSLGVRRAERGCQRGPHAPPEAARSGADGREHGAMIEQAGIFMLPASVFVLVLTQMIHVEIVRRLQPVLMHFHGERPNQTQAQESARSMNLLHALSATTPAPGHARRQQRTARLIQAAYLQAAYLAPTITGAH